MADWKCCDGENAEVLGRVAVFEAGDRGQDPTRSADQVSQRENDDEPDQELSDLARSGEEICKHGTERPMSWKKASVASFGTALSVMRPRKKNHHLDRRVKSKPVPRPLDVGADSARRDAQSVSYAGSLFAFCQAKQNLPLPRR